MIRNSLGFYFFTNVWQYEELCHWGEINIRKNIFSTSESELELGRALQQTVPQVPRPSKMKSRRDRSRGQEAASALMHTNTSGPEVRMRITGLMRKTL